MYDFVILFAQIMTTRDLWLEFWWQSATVSACFLLDFFPLFIFLLHFLFGWKRSLVVQNKALIDLRCDSVGEAPDEKL